MLGNAIIGSSSLRPTINANYIGELSDKAMKIASDIESQYGVYKRKQLLLRHSLINSDGTQLSITDTLIEPTPRITLISPNPSALFKDSGVDLTQNDYQVKGIPLSYSIDFLHNNILFYIIDPQFNSNLTEIIGGIYCKPILRSEEKILQRVMTLRQEVDVSNEDTTYYKNN